MTARTSGVGMECAAIEQVLAGTRGEVRRDEPLSRHTSFRIGGPADALVSPKDLEDLRGIVRRALREGVPLFVLGGSNVLVRDGGIRGIVLRLSRLNRITLLDAGAPLRERGSATGGVGAPARCFVGPSLRSGRPGNRSSSEAPPHQMTCIDAEAGVPLPSLAHWAMEHGLAGLEFASGIPATLGGAIVMNAGTREGEVGPLLDEVRLIERDGTLERRERERLEFSYRRSAFPEGSIVVGAVLRLTPGRRDEIAARMKELVRRRKATQPLSVPNAGCVFKNPEKESAGSVIDRLGLKGRRVGDAEVSTRHANFIVNRGKATAREVLELIRVIRETAARTGVTLEMEVRVVGEDPHPVPSPRGEREQGEGKL